MVVVANLFFISLELDQEDCFATRRKIRLSNINK